jgi:hypothetical protein
MFKIVDLRNMDGKIRITIETDDSTTVLMLRFFSQADKFAEFSIIGRPPPRDWRRAKKTDLYYNGSCEGIPRGTALSIPRPARKSQRTVEDNEGNARNDWTNCNS